MEKFKKENLDKTNMEIYLLGEQEGMKKALELLQMQEKTLKRMIKFTSENLKGGTKDD